MLVTSLSASMSLGGGIDQALLDALEAAYKDVCICEQAAYAQKISIASYLT